MQGLTHLTYFDLLPSELHIEILLYLKYNDLLNLKHMFPTISTNKFWIVRVHHDYPKFNIEDKIDTLSCYLYKDKIKSIFTFDILSIIQKDYKILLDQYNNYELLWYILKIGQFNNLFLSYNKQKIHIYQLWWNTTNVLSYTDIGCYHQDILQQIYINFYNNAKGPKDKKFDKPYQLIIEYLLNNDAIIY